MKDENGRTATGAEVDMTCGCQGAVWAGMVDVWNSSDVPRGK